jgi:hypothetical protein
VARGNKLGGAALPPEKPEVLLETIIEDVIRASALSFADWWALSQAPLTPLAIPVGPGREYPVTQTGVDAAHKLTEQVWKARADYRQTVVRKNFDRLSFTAIGEAVANSPSHLAGCSADDTDTVPDDSFFSAVAADYTANLDRLADNARGDVDRHIPCHLFDPGQGVPAFAVGPVEFLPRPDWLVRYVTNPVQLG